MKRLSSLLLCICILLTLSSCSIKGESSQSTDKIITVSVAVTSDESILEKQEIEIQYGLSAFSALKTVLDSKGIPFEYTGSVGRKTVYITAIDGLREKSDGLSSGWKYRVNGQSPSKSSCAYVLENGDFVEWYFAKDIGE